MIRSGSTPAALSRSWRGARDSVVPAPRTILAGVRKLPPATVLTVEPDGARRSTVYWDPPFARDPARVDWTAEDWQDGLLEALRTAVDRRSDGELIPSFEAGEPEIVAAAKFPEAATDEASSASAKSVLATPTPSEIRRP